MRRSLGYLFFSLLFLLAAAPASAGDKALVAGGGERPWSVALKTQVFYNSHTSYEFGNPLSPYQIPLSRLEFPIDTLWVGLEGRRSFGRFSAGAEILRNAVSSVRGKMEDSDWDDDDRPTTRSIYSASRECMEPSYMAQADIDMSVADWLGLPQGFDLRPVVGVRWQRFTLVSFDGIQSYPAPGDTTPPVAIPGDGIRFEQTYWHYFMGLRTSMDLMKEKGVPRLTLTVQGDWARVEGLNNDHHLLRPGMRVTTEQTRGDAWNAVAGVQYRLTARWSILIDLGYRKIFTTGSHHLTDSDRNIDMSWERGVTVWSEQKSLSAALRYQF